MRWAALLLLACAHVQVQPVPTEQVHITYCRGAPALKDSTPCEGTDRFGFACMKCPDTEPCLDMVDQVSCVKSCKDAECHQ